MKKYNWKPLIQLLVEEIHPGELAGLLEELLKEYPNLTPGYPDNRQVLYILKKLVKVLRRCSNE